MFTRPHRATRFSGFHSAMPPKRSTHRFRRDRGRLEQPDLARIGHLLHGRTGLLTTAITGLFVLAVLYTLYLGKAFFLPLVIALLLDRLLSPVVKALRRISIPSPLGAAFVLAVLIGGTATTVYYLSYPASQWIQDVPENIRQAEFKLRALIAPVERVQAAAQEVQEAAQGATDDAPGETTVSLERPSLAETVLGQTQAFLVGTLVTFFLLYFLLAAGDHFLRTLVHVLPHLKEQRKAVEITHRIDAALSTYLLTAALINVGLGVVVALAMYLLGMPNPELWGMLAAFLNFIAYIGPVITTTIIGFVALVSFDTVGMAILPPLVYFTINALEGYLVTPFVMGRRLTLNPVFIFLSVIFWGWMWGVAGGLLAVPLLVAFKIFCDNIDVLKPVGEFLE
jgi:predicted PurR-regulated permease PerM